MSKEREAEGLLYRVEINVLEFMKCVRGILGQNSMLVIELFERALDIEQARGDRVFNGWNLTGIRERIEISLEAALEIQRAMNDATLQACPGWSASPAVIQKMEKISRRMARLEPKLTRLAIQQ